MAKQTNGKRIRKLREKIDATKLYSLEEACRLVAESKSTKFDETVEVVFQLGVDTTKAEQTVRGSVPLPNGLGKNIRVAVFAKGEKAAEAQAAGADVVGAEDLAERIKGGFLEFDNVVATPDMMGQVGKVGKILGPRGLMPSPKVGTVTFDIGPTVKSLKAGRAEFRADKTGLVHSVLGKASFGAEKVLQNATAMIGAINLAKPQASKGVYLQSACLCLTMGPSVKVDVGPLRT